MGRRRRRARRSPTSTRPTTCDASDSRDASRTIDPCSHGISWCAVRSPARRCWRSTASGRATPSRPARHRGADGDPRARSRPGAGAVRGRRCARPATTSSSRSGSAAPRASSTSAADVDTIAYCLAADASSPEQARAAVQHRDRAAAAAGARRRARAPLPRELVVRHLRQGRARRGRGALRAGRRRARRVAASVRAALPDRLADAPARVRPDRRAARRGALHAPTASCVAVARRRRPAQRARQARSATRCSTARCPLADAGAARVGPALVRARAEGRGRGHPGAVRGVGAVEPGGRGGRALRPDGRRLPARRALQRVHASPSASTSRA